MTTWTEEGSTLQGLAARVAAATGADRALDVAIERAFCASAIQDDHLDRFPQHAGTYTASLDAALALVERVLPGATAVIRKSAPGYWMRDGKDCGRWGVILNDNPGGWTVAPTPALALLSALLSALSEASR